jgi:hypothetical protein
MKKVLVLGSLIATPFVTLAGNGTTLWGLLGMFDQVLRIVTPMLLAVSVLYFMYTVLMYTLGKGAKSEDAKKQIEMALDRVEQVFGRRPKGLWPSEHCVSSKTLDYFSELGISWTKI